MSDRYLPPDLATGDVAAVVGLISDTHMPQRCPELPAVLFDVLAGADLLLHAGDVGELWVLDRLGDIAPVVAVHGNDDTPSATRELPYQQLLAVAGQRILLWHSHRRERSDELAARRGDDWEPKLAQRAERGRRAEASVVVFGHTHVPMSARRNGILLVNPGAIASGSEWTRQVRQTVAFLFVTNDGRAAVSHVDLAHPDSVYEAEVTWAAGFKAANARYEAPILAPNLAPYLEQLRRDNFSAPFAVRAAILRISRRCWAGEQRFITADDILNEVEGDATVPEEDKSRVRALVAEASET